jgi:hypothetical protein
MQLPAGWDFARDLVVLAGCGGDDVIAALAQHGQERLFVYRPRGGADRPPAAGELIRDPADLLAKLIGLTGVSPEHVSMHRTPSSDVTQEELQALADVVRDALRSRQLQMQTVSSKGPTWLLQGIENLPRIAELPSIESLADAFAGRPCAIVSPGPSLTKNIDLLPGLADRVLVMTGTHTLSALTRAGVRPDLVMAADPIDLTRHFEGTEPADVGALVVAATCSSATFAVPVERRFTFASNGPIDDWIFEGFGESASLPSGGSVACSELSLALELGCDPIFFLGQDLAFTEGRYYAETTLDGGAKMRLDDAKKTFHLVKEAGNEDHTSLQPDGELWFAAEQEVFELPGWDGGTVLTSPSFQAFHIWFETIARTLRRDGGARLVNCTEGGARIEGMEHLALAELATQLPDEAFDARATLAQRFAGQGAEARRRRLAEHVRGMVTALDPCAELARRCKELARKAERDPARVDKLGEVEAKLSEALKPVRLFKLVAYDEVLAAKERARVATDLRENLAAARALFGVVERGVKLLRDPLGRALKALER